jgi:hypothetical protein
VGGGREELRRGPHPYIENKNSKIGEKYMTEKNRREKKPREAKVNILVPNQYN